MNKDVTPEPTDNDILTALTYCGVSDGDLCGSRGCGYWRLLLGCQAAEQRISNR